MLVKVRYSRSNRKDWIEICELMRATVIDLSDSMMTIQFCDTPERVSLFLKMLKNVRIVEITRTGTLALTKCMETAAPAE